MKTKNTKTIHLEIEQDKVPDFYFSLLRFKMSDKPDIEALKTMADAIHLDNDSLMKSLETSELQEQNINDNLLSIHNYLLQSKKKSEDYFKVSKENFEQFKTSTFIADLYDILKLMELSQKWKGKEESAEVKAGIAAFAYVLCFFVNSIAEGLGEALSEGLKVALSLKNVQNQSYKVIENKKGNVCFTGGENETLEFEVFIENNGQIIKTKITSNNIEKILNLENIDSAFLKIENKAIQMRFKENNNVEIIIYENVVERNKKLDLTKAEIVSTVSIPKDQIETNLTITEDGSYIFQPEETTPNRLVSNIFSQIIKKENEPKIINPSSVQAKADFNIDKALFTATFNPFEESVSMFLKAQANKGEETEARDRIILIVYDLLKEHYPDTTIHTSATITGYICSTIGLLDTEVQQDRSKRLQTYRKYLTNTVYQILKKHSRIIK